MIVMWFLAGEILMLFKQTILVSTVINGPMKTT